MIGAIIAQKKIAEVFAALNRHDLAAFLADWRDDGVYIYPGDVAESGTFTGKAAVESWFRNFFEQFPSVEFTVRDICVRNIFDLVGTNVVAVQWSVLLKNNEGFEGKNDGITMITIEKGKVLQAKNYVFDVGDHFRKYWGAI